MRKVYLSLSLNASIVADQKGSNLEVFHSPGLLKFQGKDWDICLLLGVYSFFSLTQNNMLSARYSVLNASEETVCSHTETVLVPWNKNQTVI